MCLRNVGHVPAKRQGAAPRIASTLSLQGIHDKVPLAARGGLYKRVGQTDQ